MFVYLDPLLKSFDKLSHKMVKHTLTIRRQQPTNYCSVFDHFVGFGLKGLMLSFRQIWQVFLSIVIPFVQDRIEGFSQVEKLKR